MKNIQFKKLESEEPRHPCNECGGKSAFVMKTDFLDFFLCPGCIARLVLYAQNAMNQWILSLSDPTTEDKG